VSSRNAPWCPPIVELGGGIVGHLLAWEMHERDGSWHAWVSWVHETGGRHVHKVVDVRAGSLQPLEHPDAYSAVPRRVRGNDGLIRPWSGESGLPQCAVQRALPVLGRGDLGGRDRVGVVLDVADLAVEVVPA
jgi:hypothetical protein